MTALARAFVALVPPPEVVDALEARVAPLRGHAGSAGLRWIPPYQWHVTLRFLGRVADVEGLLASLDAVAGPFAAPDVRLVGGGAFSRASRGTVLWVGVEHDERLTGVAGAVEAACVAAGFPAEDRPLRPHVTVARSARARDLRGLVEAIGADAVGERWTVGDVRLVESDTRPDGAVHDEVARVPLRG